jgi:hypothetical protein
MTTQQFHASSPPSADEGGRAFGPGPRAVLTVAIATVCVAAVVLGLLVSGAATPARHPGDSARAPTAAGALDYGKRPVRTSGKSYGYVPAWLGRQTVPVGRTVTATRARPWLAVQGDTVRLELQHAHVLAMVVGPAVPEEGRFPVPKVTRCTFTVTLTQASAPIRIGPGQFRAIDEQGQLHTLRVTGAGGGRMPAEVRPGSAVKFKLTAVLPVGQGDVAWAPLAGVRPLIRWDFDVEID